VSTTAAALTVLATLAISLPATYWQIRRAAGAESTRDRIIHEARQRTGLADTTPGIDTGLQDACELIWDLPAYGTPDPDLDEFCDRLRDAIRDHRTEEGL